MKCFEKLLRDFITSSLLASIDSMQFAYHHNRSTDDAIAHLLHTTLTHLDKVRALPSLPSLLVIPSSWVSDNNERAYLENWWQENNLLLNVSKTKELQQEAGVALPA
ncbi:hypothetical protein P4O66_006071, partial [Electrophorus voltai]